MVLVNVLLMALLGIHVFIHSCVSQLGAEDFDRAKPRVPCSFISADSPTRSCGRPQRVATPK